MKFMITSLLGAFLTLSIATACQSSSAPTSITKVDPKPAQTQNAAHVDEDAPRISLEDAKKDYDAGTAIFVDTRSAQTFDSEHIKGAISVPINELEAKINTIPTDKKIIAYCS